MEFALSLVFSTSKIQYEEIAEVSLLPSVRHLNGFKNCASGDGEGPMRSALLIAKDRNFDDGWDRSGVLTFDSMPMSQGMGWNHRTGVLTGMFMKVVLLMCTCCLKAPSSFFLRSVDCR